LCVDAVAFIYRHTKDIAFADMAAETLISNMAGPPGGHGKAFTMFSRCAPALMAFVRTVQDKSESARLAVTATADDLLIRRLSLAGPVEFLGIRGPEVKRFFVRVDGGKAETIAIERRSHGARHKNKPTGTVIVKDPKGTILKSESFDTDLPCKLEVKLSADAAKGVYPVEISDDMRGIWHVAATGGKVVLDCADGPSLAGYRSRRVFFFVPAGTAKFRLAVVPVHNGTYGLCVFDADGNVRGHTTGIKAGKETPEGWVDVKVPNGQAGKLWSMVLFASGNLRVQMEGVPPCISASPSGWFDPKKP